MTAILLAAVIFGATSQAASAKPVTADPAVALLQDLDKRFEAAWFHADATFLRGVLADDMRFTHGRGIAQNKGEFLSTLRAGTFLARDSDRVEVEVHADVAMTTGRIHVKTTTAEYNIFYVRLYARRNGEWQLLSHRTVRRVDGPLSD